MVWASSMLASVVCISAPAPVFTSSTMACAPLASFLETMLEAISGRLSTVAVTSRRAYRVLSAGARFFVWPMMAMPMACTCRINSSSLRPMRKPEMLSSLSSVPPVCPSPRPLILATGTPQAATSGASTSEVVSPTPPVECLSVGTPFSMDRSIISPE